MGVGFRRVEGHSPKSKDCRYHDNVGHFWRHFRVHRFQTEVLFGFRGECRVAVVWGPCFFRWRAKTCW